MMPGFTDVGDREEELWNAAFTETVDAVQDMFADLRRKGFFLESGNPPPQVASHLFCDPMSSGAS